ncbi:uncharacterized protein LOC133200551 [Saccostrea echinata]|uniref:uncharacterized protein LOC133200551 n=1 Tax=Saccostrea echinata TaxID=191078 RepID=UPI002A7EC71E|nr:uncharacterized protein LOC133200551 [Saccostrea echinata]
MHAIDTQELDDTVDSGEDRVNDITIVPECERPLLEADEGIGEIQEMGVTGDPESKDDFVTEADDNENTTEPENLLMQKLGKTRNLFNPLGNYSRWKTDISVKFSTLSDDEVLVLFCFLCSDSGPPDFTDTEWLDMLNEIRQIVYRKENPVTSEEAQQTLDRLKSRDYLWEDQDKITEDTKDETMYRIASKNSVIPFYYSSYDTASVYLRSQMYIRKPGEKCVTGGTYYDPLLITAYTDYFLIRRLQMNILTHVTMEFTTIYDDIHQILNVSNKILKESEDKREEFLMDLRRGGEAVHYRRRSQDSVDHVTWLWRYEFLARPDIVRSCIGLNPHNDIYIIDNKAYRKTSKHHNYTPEVRCLLYCFLLTEKYQLNLNEQSHRITRDKIRDRYFPDITDDSLVDLPNAITKTRNGVITFISDDIRHDVMYAFVTECLVEDSDLEFFLTTASRDVISEYCRSWWYKRSEGEKCLYVPYRPEEMYELFIDKLQLDIITHCTVSDRLFHDSISQRLNIPEEVLKWDLEERKRFVDKINQGSVPMYRARCLLVGCTGAGKTTVLRNLKRKKGKEETKQPTETTIGLDVHQDLFLIGQSEDDSGSTLFDYEGNASPISENDSKELLSVMDFAGQVAYYACHQVYLSRRAIYLLVVDMTQDLTTKLQQDDRNCVLGTLFEDWTALDYFTFWLQTIRTYGQEDGGKRYNTKSYDPESSEREKILTPIIVLATHRDSYKYSKAYEEDTSAYGSFYVKLRKQIPENIKNLVCKHFELELPPQKRSKEELRELEKVRRYIAKTTKSLSHWGEKVPKQWSDFEEIIREKQGLKISSREELKKFSEYFLEDDFNDMLKFYHEIGMILYFPDLGPDVILDIQWFVDAFKYIITDRKHVSIEMATDEYWDKYFDGGVITESLMLKIWEEKIGRDSLYDRYLNRITPFMEKLGILAKMDMKYTQQNQCYYVPSMNKRHLEKGENWTEWEKTPIISFYFKTYLPHFFFFRLVVACFAFWDAKEDNLYKNLALFKGTEKDEYHTVVIAVNKTSIQLQVLTPGNDIPLCKERTREIRLQIEKKIAELTKTFHGNVEYEIGFPCPCEPFFITQEDEKRFISERELQEISTENPPCPRCDVFSKKRIKVKELLEIWGKKA